MNNIIQPIIEKYTNKELTAEQLFFNPLLDKMCGDISEDANPTTLSVNIQRGLQVKPYETETRNETLTIKVSSSLDSITLNFLHTVFMCRAELGLYTHLYGLQKITKEEYAEISKNLVRSLFVTLKTYGSVASPSFKASIEEYARELQQI